MQTAVSKCIFLGMFLTVQVFFFLTLFSLHYVARNSQIQSLNTFVLSLLTDSWQCFCSRSWATFALMEVTAENLSAASTWASLSLDLCLHLLKFIAEKSLSHRCVLPKTPHHPTEGFDAGNSPRNCPVMSSFLCASLNLVLAPCCSASQEVAFAMHSGRSPHRLRRVYKQLESGTAVSRCRFLL